MLFRPDWKIAGTAFGLLLAASSLAAQTPDAQAGAAQDPLAAPADSPDEDVATAPGPAPIDETFPALAECRATNESLRTIISQGVSAAAPADNTQVERLRTELDQCRQDERLNRTTNQRLNNELVECRAGFGLEQGEVDGPVDLERERDEARAELATARTALEAANAEIAALKARLDSVGVSAEPGFRYAGSVDSSYVRRDVADTNVRDDLKLSSDRCEEALAWLDTQTGTDLWLRKMVWVWNADRDVLLCAPTAAGDFEITPASPSDEAHAIIFE